MNYLKQIEDLMVSHGGKYSYISREDQDLVSEDKIETLWVMVGLFIELGMLGDFEASLYYSTVVLLSESHGVSVALDIYPGELTVMTKEGFNVDLYNQVCTLCPVNHYTYVDLRLQNS